MVKNFTKKSTGSNNKEHSISDRQHELLSFIENCVNREHRMPSYREMARFLKVSAVGTVQDHLKRLLDAGYLIKEGRRLKLNNKLQAPILSVPIVGEVAAGSLTDAYEVALGSLPVAVGELSKRAAQASAEDYFALRVSGESMIDAGILPRDIVVVDRQARVKSGDFVVAALRSEATVKEIEFLPQEKVRLIPHNARLKPFVVNADEEFRVMGKVIAVHRYI